MSARASNTSQVAPTQISTVLAVCLMPMSLGFAVTIARSSYHLVETLDCVKIGQVSRKFQFEKHQQSFDVYGPDLQGAGTRIAQIWILPATEHHVGGVHVHLAHWIRRKYQKPKTACKDSFGG